MDEHDHRAPAGGTGPGPITPDGCSVELYASLPARGEPEVVHGAIPPHAAVLELGCGTGRIGTPLTRMGHRVVGVDESAEMLDHCVAIATVCARIQDLRLPERFPVVLLASHLINTADAEARTAFLRTCRAHVEAGGTVVVQRHRPGWIAEAGDFEHDDGSLRTSLRVLARPGPGLLHGLITYQRADLVWTQEFTAREVDDAALPGVLGSAGLRLERMLTEDGGWFAAVPALEA